MNLIKLKCASCNAPLEVDLDNLQVYCPYCGQKLMIDVQQMKDLLIEREKTRQMQLGYDYSERKARREDQYTMKLIAILLGVLAVSVALVIFL